MKDYRTIPMHFKKLLALIALACLVCGANRAEAMSSTAWSDADYRTQELVALAAGLNNDRDLIFQWVKKNIKYVQYYGCKKGAYLTYLERSGNDADQSALLVALWRAAGISCQYYWGWIQMPVSDSSNVDWYHYLGADGTQVANPSNGYRSVDQLLSLRDEPGYGWWSGTAGDYSSAIRGMSHVWVQTTVNGVVTDYDPSFKLIQPVAGVGTASLMTMMGYNRANLLSSLGAGTSGSNSITGLNYSALSTYLSGRASQFIASYRNSYFDKTVEEITGGWKPLSNSIVDGNNFPVSAAGAGYNFGPAGGTAYTSDVTDGLAATLGNEATVSLGYATVKIRVCLATDTVHASPILTWGPYNIATLRGQRLGLVFESNKATLKLEDTQVAQATQTTADSTKLVIVMDITHAGDASYTDPAFNVVDKPMVATAGGTYVITYGFDVSPEWLADREKKITSYKEQGLTDADPRMRLETLNVIGLQWMLETGSAMSMVGDIKNVSTSFLHRFGRAAQEIVSGTNTAVYVDLPFNGIADVSRIPDSNATNTNTLLSAWSYISSAMEHGVLEQMQNNITEGVSTTKVLKMANEQSIPVFLADSSNWSGTGGVQSQLTSGTYTSTTLTDIGNEINAGSSMLLPKTGQMTQPGWIWKGPVYAALLWDSTGLFHYKMIISQSYAGGFSSLYTTAQSYSILNQSNASTKLYQSTPANLNVSYGLDPVDLATGSFTHHRELLTAGEGSVRGLDFSVNYDGSNRMKDDAKLGYGWTHSYYARATELADIEGAFGKKTPIEMASSLVGAIAAMDVFQNRTTVKDWLATALIANWTVDQLKGSAVSIVSGDKIWQFHKQSDGTYTPPPGSTLALAKVSSLYQLTERNGPTWKFDSSNRLSEIGDYWGKKLTLTYNTSGTWADALATVTDAYGRQLTFTYGTSGLSSVTDNSSPARGVGFNIDTNHNLVQFSDPQNNYDRFDYNAGHLISNYRNDNNDIVVSNTYDSQGRVATQDTVGDSNKRWHLYYAPGQTIETEPEIAGQSSAVTTHYFDDRNREVKVVDALGHEEATTYDAQDRVTERHKRISDSNGTIDDSEYFTYDTYNNLASHTDPKNCTTYYSYDTQNQLYRILDNRGYSTWFQNYNGYHLSEKTIDRNGRTFTYTYKPDSDPGAGYLATSVEGSGYTTSYGYDSHGALNLISYPNGNSESRINNSLGDPTTLTDGLSRSTTIVYNNRREVVSKTLPGTPSHGNRTTITTYDNKRDVATVGNPRHFTTTTNYSVTHQLLTTQLPGGATITNHYNNRDRLDWTKNPLNQTTNFGLDVLGRTTSVTDPLSRTTSSIFQDGARKVTTQGPAPLNIATSAIQDSRGQVVQDTDGLAHSAYPGYDANGNKTSWLDRRGKQWTFTYDGKDNLMTITSPLNRSTTYARDSRNLVHYIYEPSGQTTTMTYDNRRRLTGRSDAVGSITYGLDAANQLKTVTEGSVVLTRTYYDSGEVATYKNGNNETIFYDYDENGNLTSLTYPAVGSVPALTVSYEYDNRDRLTKMTESGRVTTYTWDDAGRLTGITRPNGTRRTQRWDGAGQLLSVEERPAASGAPFAVRSFHHDAAGRIDKRLSYPQGAAWTEYNLNAGVNDDNQLTGGILNYDADGNTLASLMQPGPWGATGNMTWGTSGTYTWNARNQLGTVACSGSNGTYGYIYDAEGNLIRTDNVTNSTSTRWIVDPDGGERSRVLMKVASNGDVTRYVYGIGLAYEIRQDGSVRYYHYDQLGSTIALTDATGQIKGRADYSPYGALVGGTGELANANTTPFLWVGAYGVMTDPGTGLHQMRARWYSSYLRRFLNPDPSNFAGGENFFAYASGNPISLVDPMGLRPEAGNKNSASLLTARQQFITSADTDGNGRLSLREIGIAVEGADPGLQDVPFSPIDLGVAGVVKGIAKTIAVNTITTESKLLIQFGKSENQVFHAFRHTDALGLDRGAVQAAVQNNAAKFASQITTGKPFNKVIEVGGTKIQYTAFKLPDGTINIGRIHEAP